MNNEYVRENGKTYLKAEEETGMDCMQMKMFMENTTDNFLTITKYRINDKAYYKYDVSSMMVMSSVFEDSEMHADDITSLISSIREAVSETDRYLVESDGIILDPDHIFRNDSGKWKFIYFSSADRHFEDGLRELFEYIIRRVCHKDSAGSAMAYGIYKRICDGENDLDRLFETEESKNTEEAEIREERQVIESVMPQAVQEENEVPDKFRQYLVYGIAAIWAMAVIVFLVGLIVPGLKIGEISSGGCFLILLLLAAGGYCGVRWYLKNKDSMFRIKTENKPVPYEQENVRILIPEEKQKPDEEYTVVLNSRHEKNYHSLTWDENGCRRSYSVNGDVCIIGSSPDKADCVINATGVSRAHARISREGEHFFVKDLNSTNGTAVNDKVLACYEICEIRQGDIVTVGNVKCVFN